MDRAIVPAPSFAVRKILEYLLEHLRRYDPSLLS
jgi:hypothetical protein